MDKLTVFEHKEIRQIDHNGEIWFSIVDIIEVLTGSPAPRQYWNILKKRENQLSTICCRLKMTALDGKRRLTDCANTENIFIIIMSVPSPKVQDLKLWLAQAGKEKLQALEEFKTINAFILNHAQLSNSPSAYKPKTYLMRDSFRGYYKIGKSKNPKIRECTLQAEVPTIELLHVIEDDIETYLHKKFDTKRLRGEWFDLTHSDVNYIKSY